MVKVYDSPITIDNSKERGSLLGLCRSFYWKLSKDYKRVRRSFTSCDEGFELRTKSYEEFTRVLLALDLSLTTFSYYRFLNTFIVLVEEF